MPSLSGFFHRVTMKKKKHPKDMTSEELARHVFHPKVVRHAKKLANPSKKSMKEK